MKTSRSMPLSLYLIAIVLFVAEVVIFPRCARALEVGVASESAGLEDLELRALRRSRRANELTRVSQVSGLASDRANCAARLKAGLLPSFCFKVLHDEVTVGLITTQAATREASWLTRVCIERARTSARWLDLQTFLHSAFIPSSCREVVETRLSDLRYLEEEERPDALFSRRWQSDERSAGVDRNLKRPRE